MDGGSCPCRAQMEPLCSGNREGSATDASPWKRSSGASGAGPFALFEDFACIFGASTSFWMEGFGALLMLRRWTGAS